MEYKDEIKSLGGDKNSHGGCRKEKREKKREMRRLKKKSVKSSSKIHF
jgi:hypothetical protein